MSLLDWSLTPSENGTAPGINWAEGMPPRSVNDSARQMMADILDFVLGKRKDYIQDDTLTDAIVAQYPLAMYKSALGRRYRLSPMSIWVERFGAVGDGVTINTTAIRSAVAYAAFCGRVDSTGGGGAFQKGAPPTRFGIGEFLVDGACDLHATHRILGQGQGMELGGGGTVIRQTAYAHVFIVNRFNTANFAANPPGVNGGGADGTEFGGISFRYSGGGVRSLSGPSAVASHARINFHDSSVEGFAGPGWQVRATSGGGGTIEGEASGASIRRVVTNGNFCGGYLAGGDANVEEVTSCVFGNNDTWGLLGEQFLSCTFINCHFKGNGNAYTISYQGKRYAVMYGKEAAASTTPPGTDPTVWSYVDDNGSFPAWVSGGNYTAGGSVAHVNRNARSVFLSCYHESGSGAPIVQFPAISVGGQWAHAIGADGVHYTGEQGVARARGFTAVRSDISSSASMDPITGLSVQNGLAGSVSTVYIGPRGKGYRIGVGQGDADTTMYIQGIGDANPGWTNLLKVMLAGPYASNAAAVAAGLPAGVGALYYTAGDPVPKVVV